MGEAVLSTMDATKAVLGLLRDLCERIGHDDILLTASTATTNGVVLRCQRCERLKYVTGHVVASSRTAARSPQP